MHLCAVLELKMISFYIHFDQKQNDIDTFAPCYQGPQSSISAFWAMSALSRIFYNVILQKGFCQPLGM